VGEVRGTETGDDERRTVARCGRPNFPFHVDTTAVETGHHHTTDPLKPKRSTSTRPQRVIHGLYIYIMLCDGLNFSFGLRKDCIGRKIPKIK